MTVAAARAAPAPVASSASAWGIAWQRFREDRVGVVSLAIVLAFLVLVVLAASGLVARHWQAEVGVPNAPPHFMGPAPAEEGIAGIELPEGPNVDLSDVDPLAPRYAEWPPNVANKIMLTKAFVVKNAAFIFERSFGLTSVC